MSQYSWFRIWGAQGAKDGTGRLHRLSTLKFIPEGNEVARVLIHLIARTFHRQESWLYISSVMITATFAWKCALLLKCAATRDSSVLWYEKSKWWLFILQCKVFQYCPCTLYCWLSLIAFLYPKNWKISWLGHPSRLTILRSLATVCVGLRG